MICSFGRVRALLISPADSLCPVLERSLNRCPHFDSVEVTHQPFNTVHHCWTQVSSVLLSTYFQTHEDSQESLTSLPRRDTMGSYLPDNSSYELLTVIGVYMKTFGWLFNTETHRSRIPDGRLCFRPRLGWIDDGELGSIQTHWGARRHPTDRPGVLHQWHGQLPSGLHPCSVLPLSLHPPSLSLSLGIRLIFTDHCPLASLEGHHNLSSSPGWTSRVKVVSSPQYFALQERLYSWKRAVGHHPLYGLWWGNTMSSLMHSDHTVAWWHLLQHRSHDYLVDGLPGSARDLICTHFSDGMSELTIAYILLGMLKALEYIHHMGYVHR